MVEITDSEVDVERLMAEIREAVARREAEGPKSLISASLELSKILARFEETPATPSEWPPLRLQPEFAPSPDSHYHLNDLLQYHDQTFVWNAYRAILKREPDETGLAQFLQGLRSGRLNKIDVLAGLRFSPEGRRVNVRVDGLTRRPILRRLYRVPVFGYLLEMIVAIVRLPEVLRRQRQFEAHALAQQEILVNHINQISQTVFPVLDSLSRELAEVAGEPRRLAALQLQQAIGLLREQREMSARLRKLKDESGAGTADSQATADAERGQWDEFFASFADEFRGGRTQIKEGLRFYLPLLKAAGIKNNILDIGCGRGEWLELLKEEGFDACGVEINRVMVEQARGLGLEVIEEDALAHLRSLPTESLDAVTGFHLIEHLSFAALIELLGEIRRTLRPGGLVIFETPNPKNLTVAACNFYADPSHRQPVFPETLEFILKHQGFADVQLEYLNPVEKSPFRNDNPGSQELDTWFFGARDFAAIARKAESLSTPAKITGTKDETEHVLEVAIEDQIETVKLETCVSQTGHKFYARPRTDDRIIFESVVDRDEYPLPPKFDARDVVIDIGAHIGSFSYAVLKRGAGKVYAYEAHPINHAITRKNLEQFGERADCRNLAVWRSDVPSQTLFNDRLNNQADPNTGGYAVVYNNEGLPIQTVGLDDILREATDGFKKKVRLLKLDCEGAEYPILFSAKHLKAVEEICGEYHEIEPDIVPLRARVEGMPARLDRHALKNFLEAAGWSVEIQPVSDDARLGHFRARRKKSFFGL